MSINPFIGYLRWRHSKGYGVHSPYAYRFVTDVVRPGDYGYYAYRKLDTLRHLSGRDESRVRFLIRLMVFLKTSEVVTEKESYPASLAAIAAEALGVNYQSGISQNQEFNNTSLVIVAPDTTDTIGVRKAIESGSAVLVFKPSAEIRDLLLDTRDNGLLIRGKNTQLFVPRKEMRFVAYDMRLSV